MMTAVRSSAEKRRQIRPVGSRKLVFQPLREV
mgnify:CR=1 FL=1